MKIKIRKYLVIILIINMLFNPFNLILSNISFGEYKYGGSLRGEVGPIPADKPIDDDKQPVIPELPKEETKKEYSLSYYTKIEGNAYEQLREDKGIVIDKNEIIGIQNIKVEAINEYGRKYTEYTDSQGKYAFNNLPAGLYTLKFTYGGYESTKTSDVVFMKSNLKYNGLDYMATKAGGTVKDKLTITERTIIHSGTGATEIMLIIDCSASAWNTKVDGTKSRVEVQKEAAKDLIEGLINEKNVYIGIIVFAGDKTATRVSSVTKDKDKLFKTLDAINEESIYCRLNGGTNILEALNKAYDSFVSKESNKWMVLLSDGAPTTDGKEQIYSNDSDEDLLKKLKSIANNTKNRIKEIIKDDIKICSFIIDSPDDFETQLVQAIFKDVGDGYMRSTDQEATNKIKNDILKHIIDNTEVTENVTNTVVSKEFSGVEDKDRREAANKFYELYDYTNSTMIDNLINNYNPTNIDNVKDAKNLLEGTYITVTINKKYEIDELEKEDDDFWYLKRAGKKSKVKYPKTPEKKTWSNQNLELTKRETLDMEVEIKTTGYRLTLSNGQIYNEKITNGVVDKDLNPKTVLKEIEEIGDAIFLQSIDEKMMYGARVDIEYTIILKNISSVPVSNVKLINYLTDFTSGNELLILEYDENRKMITNKYTNKEYGWKEVNKTDLSDKVSADTYSKMKNDKYITLETADSKLLRQRQQIGTNGERYIKLVLSKHLSTDTKNDNTDFSTTTEIINYSNDLGIRMRKQYTNSSGDNDRLSVIPGNTIEGINKVYDINNKGISETDYAKSMRVVIIPPTGEKADIVLSLVVFIEVLLIVLFRRLRIISRR